MWSRELLTGALVASCAVGSQAAALHRRDNETVEEPAEPPITCESVNIRDLHDSEEAKKIWDQSIAGVIGDDFINNDGIEHWVENLDQEIFSSDVSDSWSCFDWDTVCQLKHNCPAYEEAGQPGAYFLFYSLQQFRSFLNSFHERLQDNTLKQILNVNQIQSDFKDESEPDSILSIVSSSFALVAPVLGAAGPVMSIISGGLTQADNLMPDGDEDADDGTKEISVTVRDSFESMREYLDNLGGAVFGKPGYGQDLIPGDVQRQSFANEAINVLGDGQWLISDPTAGLRESMDEFYHRMKQALAWQMFRIEHHAFVFIDDPVTESECGHNYNAAVWDPENEWCFRLFHQPSPGSFRHVQPVEDDIADKLWDEDGDYKLDRLETYRNAYNCWIDSDGEMGSPEFQPDLEPDTLPNCHFKMIVKKGTFKRAQIVMSEFPGQKTDGYWTPRGL